MYVSTWQKLVVAWKNSSGAGRARVGTISGSPSAPAISFGTEAGFTSNNIDADFDIAMEYDFANGQADGGPTFIHHDLTQGKLVATPGIISGTSLSTLYRRRLRLDQRLLPMLRSPLGRPRKRQRLPKLLPTGTHQTPFQNRVGSWAGCRYRF